MKNPTGEEPYQTWKVTKRGEWESWLSELAVLLLQLENSGPS